MTYLEMVKLLWTESGTGGREPTSILNQVGEIKRLIGWIKRADREIQLEHTDWGFLWDQASVPTIDGQSVYSMPANLREYDENTFRLDGERVEVVDYLDVKDDIPLAGPSKPYRVVMLPNNRLRLDPTPNGVFTLTYDYYINPVAMADQDAAESIIPAPYRSAIVGRALMMYANYEVAQELMPQAQLMYQSHMQPLESAWLPGNRNANKQAEGNFFGVQVE